MEYHPFITGRWFDNLNNNHLFEEKWFINRPDNENVKSFAYIPHRDTESIILGTFPIWEISSGRVTVHNFEFFYGSSVNEFWGCLRGIITNTNIENLTNRISLLDNLKIGITDILLKIDRQPNNCNSDTCLTELKYNNLLDLKVHYPKLKNIFITSGGRSPIPNLNERNKSVATWLRNSINNQGLRGFNVKGFVKPITRNKQPIFKLIYLYSPSHAGNIAIQGILNANNNFGINGLNIEIFRKIQWSYFLNKYHSVQIPQYGVLNDQLEEFFEK